jgi:uncharacterized protein (TIGR02300 family)
VTKPELGTKRLCAGCNAKFYDLNKSRIVCPMCEAVFEPPKPAPVRPRRALDPIPAPALVPAAAVAARKSEAASEDGAVLVKSDGETEAETGVPLLEEIDED